MAHIPGIVPTPQPEQPADDSDHYVSDETWRQVLKDARRIREESDESETD